MNSFVKLLVLFLLSIVTFFSQPSAEASPALPGKYVVVIKGQNASELNFVRLATYDFMANGRVCEVFWYWDAGTPRRIFDNTRRQIGQVVSDPQLPAADKDRFLQGPVFDLPTSPTRFEWGSPYTLCGTWSEVKGEISIRFFPDSYEKWKITWSDGSLWKIELLSASYAAGAFYFSPRRRVDKAENAGWGFGAPGPALTTGSNLSLAMGKNYSGRYLMYNNAYCRNLPSETDEFNLTGFQRTSSDVARLVTVDSKFNCGKRKGCSVFTYFAKPSIREARLARQVIFEMSHDYADVGYISLGHPYSGLEIIDSKGRLRGFVFGNASPNTPLKNCRFLNDISGLFYVDREFCESPPEPSFAGPAC